MEVGQGPNTVTKYMVCSISLKSTGPLYTVHGTMLKAQYIQVLYNCLFPKMKE
jgi:hypothetical protein